MFFDISLAQKASREGQRQVHLYHTAEQMGEKTLRVYRHALCEYQQGRKSDILLCGYYGYGNLGDELSLAAISSRLLTKAAQARQKSKAASPSESFSDLRLSVLASHGNKYVGLNGVDRFDPCAIIKAIGGTGLLVLGGGSLLQNKTSNRSLLYYLSILEIAHMLGTPTMLYGSGIGPIYGKIQLTLCKRALQNVDWISVRDKASLSFLRPLSPF